MRANGRVRKSDGSYLVDMVALASQWQSGPQLQWLKKKKCSACYSPINRSWATELGCRGTTAHHLASRAALTLSGCGRWGELSAWFSALAGNWWPGPGSRVRGVPGKANRVLHKWDFQMEALTSMWQVGGGRARRCWTLEGLCFGLIPPLTSWPHMPLKYWRFPVNSSSRWPLLTRLQWVPHTDGADTTLNDLNHSVILMCSLL